MIVDSNGPGAGGGSGTSTSSSGGPAFACNYVTGEPHVCVEYDNLPAAKVQAEEQACTSGMGMPVTSCSNIDRLGTCSRTDGGITLNATYYASGGVTAMDAQQSCTGIGGTWTTG